MLGAPRYAEQLMATQCLLTSLHQRHGAQFNTQTRDAREATVPVSFGDTDGEYRALRDGCGLVDRSSAVRLVFTGTDRQRFLGGLVTCDITSLAAGTGAYGFFTDIKGHLLGDLVALAGDERLSVELPPAAGETLGAHILKYRIADRVELETVPQATTLTLMGPAASPILASFLDGAPPCEPWAHTSLAIAGTCTQVVYDVRFGVPAWSLWLEGDPLERVQALLDAGRAHGLAPVGSLALERLRIEEGRPRFGQDMGAANIPQETGLADEAVSYTKGCYLGQEIVARIHYRGGVNRRLCGLRFADSAGQPLGADLLVDDRKAGTVTSFVHAGQQGPIGLAILHRRAEDGASLAVAGGGTARVVALPFR
jgi:folate-binding protein YgfZ